MKKKFCLFVLLLLVSVSCTKRPDIVSDEGEKAMEWRDEHFMQLCSEVFNKPADHITYDDVSGIEKIMYDYSNGEAKIGVFLLKDTEAKLVDRPESPIKSIEDLVHFKNLKYFEMFGENVSGVEVLKDMPKLKTLVLKGRIDIKMLKNVAEHSHIESLTIPYLDIDYSCLSRLSSLETINVTTPLSGGIKDFKALLSLPDKGCLLNLECINAERLTPDLYKFFTTHTNVSNMGLIYIPDGSDINFFENMKSLEKVEIRGGSLDLTGISKMVWLKDLSIWGDNIDIDKLSGLINLERLSIKEEGGSKNNIYPLSIVTLEDYRNLRSLSLQGYIIEDLNGLEDYPNLITFSGKDCLIEDISALRTLSNLEYLDLSNNIITDISAIRFLQKLKHLTLNSNEISDISPLKYCINLECLIANGNYIEDISPLENLQKIEELQIENSFHYEKNDYFMEGDAELISWRNTLLSLPNLKYYVGGLPVGEFGQDDTAWISLHLPNVRYGYRDIGD